MLMKSDEESQLPSSTIFLSPLIEENSMGQYFDEESDSASDMGIFQECMYSNREVRILIETRALQLMDQYEHLQDLPSCFINLQKNKYTIVLKINETNVINHIDLYWAINIYNDFIQQKNDCGDTSNETEYATSQATTSSNQLQKLSQVSFGTK